MEALNYTERACGSLKGLKSCKIYKWIKLKLALGKHQALYCSTLHYTYPRDLHVHLHKYEHDGLASAMCSATM